MAAVLRKTEGLRDTEGSVGLQALEPIHVTTVSALAIWRSTVEDQIGATSKGDAA